MIDEQGYAIGGFVGYHDRPYEWHGIGVDTLFLHDLFELGGRVTEDLMYERADKSAFIAIAARCRRAGYPKSVIVQQAEDEYAAAFMARMERLLAAVA